MEHTQVNYTEITNIVPIFSNPVGAFEKGFMLNNTHFALLRVDDEKVIQAKGCSHLIFLTSYFLK